MIMKKLYTTLFMAAAAIAASAQITLQKPETKLATDTHLLLSLPTGAP